MHDHIAGLLNRVEDALRPVLVVPAFVGLLAQLYHNALARLASVSLGMHVSGLAPWASLNVRSPPTISRLFRKMSRANGFC